MNNILDYVKPFVDKIYKREPDYNNDILVQPDTILIKETGRFARTYTIGLTDNNVFTIVITYGNDEAMEFERETIDQVVDFVLE